MMRVFCMTGWKAQQMSLPVAAKDCRGSLGARRSHTRTVSSETEERCWPLEDHARKLTVEDQQQKRCRYRSR